MIRIFKVLVPASVFALFIADIVLMLASYTAATYLYNGGDPELFFLYEGGFQKLIVPMSVILLGLFFQDLYADIRVVSRLQLLQQLCLVTGLAFGAQALVNYWSNGMGAPAWNDDYRKRFHTGRFVHLPAAVQFGN